MTASRQWVYDLKWKFGVTEDQYRELLAKQGGRCAICLKKPGKYRLSVDHDHSCCPGARSCGRCIRGLLCGNCNLKLLGMICQESTKGKGHAVAVLNRAVAYLNDSHVIT